MVWIFQDKLWKLYLFDNSSIVISKECKTIFQFYYPLISIWIGIF
jgi:hypothetical protein